MAKSRYEYVREFETDDTLLRNTWAVLRIDGHAFHKLARAHAFRKPNDARALRLMNAAAAAVVDAANGDIVLAFGESDEFSFVLRRGARLHRRRRAKLETLLVSLFTATYALRWRDFMGDDCPLQYAPSFDARIVLYPTTVALARARPQRPPLTARGARQTNLRDYLAWRQVDTHVNNLYNTAFWALVERGALSPQAAEARLAGTLAADKNELLFSEFGINYNDEPAMFRKGSILFRKLVDEPFVDARTGETRSRQRRRLVTVHEDLIRDRFWQENAHLLADDQP